MAEGNDIKLNIKMFGGLSISHEGKLISIGKNKSAKYIQLLEIVWLSGENGITKESLMSTLYDRDEQSNLNNSFNNLIYQMHKQLDRSGLPKADYVVNRDGIFYIDSQVLVESDVDEFVRAVGDARSHQNATESIAFYQKAYDLYTAELLPELSTQEWVIIKSVALQKMFSECVVALGDYYQKLKKYDQMKRVYKRASDLYPDDEWQIGVINALIGMDNYKEAYAVYDSTIKYYTDELGIEPSKEFLDCYNQMSKRVSNNPSKIIEIRDDIVEHRNTVCGEVEGAYGCSYPSFIDAYHILSRNMERTGQSVYMMLVTLVDYEGKSITNQTKLENKSLLLQKAITLALRQGDTFCKYSPSQDLILLVGTNKESCKIVYRRILNKLKMLAGPRTELEYSVVSIGNLPSKLAEAK